MKNRLIYTLIGLMVVALIGIIFLQGVWINRAVEEREREFKTHVSDAMNKVNDVIAEEEALIFMEEKFGGIDSLLNDIFVFRSKSDGALNQEEDEVIRVKVDENRGRHISINYTSEGDHPHLSHDRRIERRAIFLEDSLKHLAQEIEVRMEHTTDSLISEVVELKGDVEDLDHISSVVQHFTYEKLISGDLEDRLPKEVLEKTLHSELAKEGVDTPFEYGVFNTMKSRFEDGYISNEFNRNENNNTYKKTLFPKDRLRSDNYQLMLQFDDNAYIWREVRPMLLLSILFTVLILICFGYSLYFIFKQKKISQVKNDFINNMTHELKTPLASISLAASSIKHPQVIQQPSEVEHFVDIIVSEKERMNSHIERVLDIASLDKGELGLNLNEVDLISIISKAISNVDLSLSQFGGNVRFEHAMTAASACVDEFHMTNVFTNILDNSIKYRKDENLSIQIDLTEFESEYRIAIEDNGIGMNAQAQRLAFDKFFRAEGGDIHNRKGFGLGLSYVKNIVELHAGNVSLKSDLGKGTTVIIVLPKTK